MQQSSWAKKQGALLKLFNLRFLSKGRIRE